MCNNSLIYLVTPSASTVLTDGTIPLATIARRRGSSIQLASDSIILGNPGYYRVSVNITFTSPTTGDATLALRQDGLPVQGGTASSTVSTATTEINNLSFDAIIRVPCCGSPITLSIVNTGIAITTSNISVNVEYLN